LGLHGGRSAAAFASHANVRRFVIGNVINPAVRVNDCTIVLRIDCSCESNRSTIKILFQMIAATAKLRIWLFSRRPDRDS
jgi:hypothetical protein